MHLAGLGQDTAVRSDLSWPRIAGVARTRQRLPFQLSARVLAGRGHQTEVRPPAPPGMGVASTCHAVPFQRAERGCNGPPPESSSPTAMQLLPPVHETPVSSVIDLL